MKQIKISIFFILSICFLTLCTPLLAGQDLTDSLQIDWNYLIGEWSAGANTGSPGEATGNAKFYYDLDKQVIIRESYASYPARGDQAAFTHRDRMIIYHLDTSPLAVYFDNEGHVIQYKIHSEADGNTYILVNEPAAGTPRFRLTYKRIDDGSLDLIFEIAPPGQPDAFNPYITSRLFRK